MTARHAPVDSCHQEYTDWIVRGENQFKRDLASLCIKAENRKRLESDLYPLWDTVLNAFASRAQDGVTNPQISVAVCSQYTLEYEYKNAQSKSSYRVKIPDSVVVETDDTPRQRVVFWAEIKSLDIHGWFTVEARLEAEAIMEVTMGQLNSQAQFTRHHFNLGDGFIIYALLIAGPYFIVVEYRDGNLSPDFFTEKYARKNARVTRSRNAEEDQIDDVKTQPLFPFGTVPHCLFEVSEEELAAQSFSLDKPLSEINVNPVLFKAFQLILKRHQGVRSIMQNIHWFDCNYES